MLEKKQTPKVSDETIEDDKSSKEETLETSPDHHEGHIPWYQTPLRYITALFLILILILWLVPHYGIKQNPEPSYLPTLQELNLSPMEIPKITSSDPRDFIQITPQIKQTADQIVTLSCQKTHKVCNAKALFYFVQKNFDYLNDPLAFEYFKTPQESFQSNSGDCDDSSILLSSLLRSIGLQTRFVKVPQHIYLQVKLPEAISSYKTQENWINLDPTCKNCQFGEIHYSYTNSQKTYLG